MSKLTDEVVVEGVDGGGGEGRGVWCLFVVVVVVFGVFFFVFFWRGGGGGVGGAQQGTSLRAPVPDLQS